MLGSLSFRHTQVETMQKTIPFEDKSAKRFQHVAALILSVLFQMLPAMAYAAQSLPSETCQTAAYDKWSILEREIWTEYICIGKTANFSERQESERIISPQFLEMVLLHGPWRDAIPRTGVRIDGA